MATAVNATKCKINENGIYRVPKPWEAANIEYTALTTAGIQIEVKKDHKAIILLKGAGQVTFTKGNTLAGIADKVVTSTADGVFFEIDSAPVTDRDGLITVKGAASISIAVLEVR